MNSKTIEVSVQGILNKLKERFGAKEKQEWNHLIDDLQKYKWEENETSDKIFDKLEEIKIKFDSLLFSEDETPERKPAEGKGAIDKLFLKMLLKLVRKSTNQIVLKHLNWRKSLKRKNLIGESVKLCFKHTKLIEKKVKDLMKQITSTEEQDLEIEVEVEDTFPVDFKNAADQEKAKDPQHPITKSSDIQSSIKNQYMMK